MPRSQFLTEVVRQLDELQQVLFERARVLREEHTHRLDTKSEFYDFFTPTNRKKPEIHGGFALCHFSGNGDVENSIKKDLNVTVRCIPLNTEEEEGQCIISQQPTKHRALLAKAY